MGCAPAATSRPTSSSYSERVQIAERDIETHAFAAAIAQAAWAAERVNRTLAEDDHVTQFELLTAAAFWELARREAQVVVVEAGLGGRYDATNVIDSQVAVLTNVGLEHTRWLGPTVADIATEKLAVLDEGSVLALGAQLQPEVMDFARAIAAERGAELSIAEALPEELRLGARGSFQRANFALARWPRSHICGAPGSPRARKRCAPPRAPPWCPVACKSWRATRLRCSTVRTIPPPPRRWSSPCRSCSVVGRLRSCSGCSRTRTRPRCWLCCCPCASVRGSRRHRVNARCRPRRLLSLARQLGL